jgi:hypothetical protein
LNQEIFSITGVADPCKPVSQGVGTPIPANATPALARKIPKTSAVTLNRDDIALGSELRRSKAHLRADAAQPPHEYQIHVYRATARRRSGSWL